MTARRLALAWSAGATCGLLVGFLVGESVRDGLDLARLGRPEPRGGLLAGTESPEPRTAPQIGAQRLRWVDLFGIDPDYTDGLPVDEWLERNRAGIDPIPAQRDGEPCPVTLGPLTCPFTGPHTNHAFQSGTWAPDRKADADERIE